MLAGFFPGTLSMYLQCIYNVLGQETGVFPQCQRVLGQEALYLPDGHPLLGQIRNSVTIQSQVLASSDGPSLMRLELMIHMRDNEANALVTLLMMDHSEFSVLEGVVEPVVLPDS